MWYSSQLDMKLLWIPIIIALFIWIPGIMLFASGMIIAAISFAVWREQGTDEEYHESLQS
jgi:hypothetical protein